MVHAKHDCCFKSSVKFQELSHEIEAFAMEWQLKL